MLSLPEVAELYHGSTGAIFLDALSGWAAEAVAEGSGGSSSCPSKCDVGEPGMYAAECDWGY